MEDLLLFFHQENMFKPAIKKSIRYKMFLGDVKQMPKHSFTINTRDSVKIVTRVLGEKETVNEAKRGDVIIAGPYMEQYVISIDKFFTLYNVVDGIATPKPIKRYVAQYTTSAKKALGIKHNLLALKAPWGEEMLVRVGDYVLHDDKGGYYRIEKKAFRKTYEFL